MHEFYAQGLPSDSPDQLPPKQVKPVTQPEPFCLEIDERGHRYQEEFKSKVSVDENNSHVTSYPLLLGLSQLVVMLILAVKLIWSYVSC